VIFKCLPSLWLLLLQLPTLGLLLQNCHLHNKQFERCVTPPRWSPLQHAYTLRNYPCAPASLRCQLFILFARAVVLSEDVEQRPPAVAQGRTAITSWMSTTARWKARNQTWFAPAQLPPVRLKRSCSDIRR